MARQTELLNQLVQAQMGHFQQQPRGRGEPLSASYQDFLNTQPPLFHKADEPLDADAWLRTIESKFALLLAPCSEENKVLFAAQQLRSVAHLWWDQFHAMQPAEHVVTWDEFQTAFRAHHIPAGLIEGKLNEFLSLTQGTRTVTQYAQVFNHLCQYAGSHADTDARKCDRFHRGLSTKLKEWLNLVKADNFNELVNMAITQEDCIAAHRAEKKQKASSGPATSQPPRYRLVSSNAPRAPPRGCRKINSHHDKVHGRAFHQLLQETAIIVVSIVEARPTSSRIALNLGNHSKGKHLIQTTRGRVRGKWCRSVKEG
jgi:hypothetical protein